VTRLPNPNDRRSAILALTGAGRAVADAADATFEARPGEILGAALSPEQVTAAARALAALRAALEGESLGMPTG
jgi:MarR family transcriptional regulator, multiple antibiotic resistance protein MarR